MWQVTTHKDVKLRNPILIEGMPGIGNVGKIVADYMIDQLKAEKVMSLFSYMLPNSVFVNEKNLVELPKIEIYHKKLKGKDYIILAGDVQPASEEGSYTFTEKILDIVQKWGCMEIVTLGGIGLAEIPEKPKVLCTANDQKFAEKFTKAGAKKEVYGIVGPIIGVTGLLVGMSTKRGIKAAALLAETYGHPMYLGLKGARESLKLLDKVYEFGLSMKDIDLEIKHAEQEEMEDSEPKSKTLKRIKKISETTYIG